MKMLAIIFCAALSWNLHAAETNEVQRAIDTDYGWTKESLDRFYANEMKTEAGRKRWHGEIVKSEFDEARMVMVETHEDGWVYERKAEPKRVVSEEERIRLNAKREALRQRRVVITNEVSVTIKPEVK